MCVCVSMLVSVSKCVFMMHVIIFVCQGVIGRVCVYVVGGGGVCV